MPSQKRGGRENTKWLSRTKKSIAVIMALIASTAIAQKSTSP